MGTLRRIFRASRVKRDWLQTDFPVSEMYFDEPSAQNLKTDAGHLKSIKIKSIFSFTDNCFVYWACIVKPNADPQASICRLLVRPRAIETKRSFKRLISTMFLKESLQKRNKSLVSRCIYSKFFIIISIFSLILSFFSSPSIWNASSRSCITCSSYAKAFCLTQPKSRNRRKRSSC